MYDDMSPASYSDSDFHIQTHDNLLKGNNPIYVTLTNKMKIQTHWQPDYEYVKELPKNCRLFFNQKS